MLVAGLLIAQDRVRSQDGLGVKAEYLAFRQISVQALLFYGYSYIIFFFYIREINGLMMVALYS
jgi:hypothetical protein